MAIAPYQHDTPMRLPEAVDWWFIGDMLTDVMSNLNEARVRQHLFGNYPIAKLQALTSNSFAKNARPYYVSGELGPELPAFFAEALPYLYFHYDGVMGGEIIFQITGVGDTAKHIHKSGGAQFALNPLTRSFVMLKKSQDYIEIIWAGIRNGFLVQQVIEFNTLPFFEALPIDATVLDEKKLALCIRKVKTFCSHAPTKPVTPNDGRDIPLVQGNFNTSMILDHGKQSGGFACQTGLPKYSHERLKYEAIRDAMEQLNIIPQSNLVVNFDFSSVCADEDTAPLPM